MRRINVSIPDALAERLERHRATLGNVSGKFQDFLTKEIDRIEEFQEGVEREFPTKEVRAGGRLLRSYEDKEELIQAALANTKLLSAGWKEGFEWACTAKPQEVFHAMQPTTMRHDFSRKDYSLKLKESLADEYLGSAVRKIWEDRYPELLIPDDEGYLSSGADQWLDGFSKGVYGYFVSMFDQSSGRTKQVRA